MRHVLSVGRITLLHRTLLNTISGGAERSCCCLLPSDQMDFRSPGCLQRRTSFRVRWCTSCSCSATVGPASRDDAKVKPSLSLIRVNLGIKGEAEPREEPQTTLFTCRQQYTNNQRYVLPLRWPDMHLKPIPRHRPPAPQGMQQRRAIDR